MLKSALSFFVGLLVGTILALLGIQLSWLYAAITVAMFCHEVMLNLLIVRSFAILFLMLVLWWQHWCLCHWWCWIQRLLVNLAPGAWLLVLIRSWARAARWWRSSCHWSFTWFGVWYFYFDVTSSHDSFVLYQVNGNFLEPKVFGKSLELHPVVVLLALAFWVCAPTALAIPLFYFMRALICASRLCCGVWLVWFWRYLWLLCCALLWVSALSRHDHFTRSSVLTRRSYWPSLWCNDCSFAQGAAAPALRRRQRFRPWGFGPLIGCSSIEYIACWR